MAAGIRRTRHGNLKGDQKAEATRDQRDEYRRRTMTGLSVSSSSGSRMYFRVPVSSRFALWSRHIRGFLETALVTAVASDVRGVWCSNRGIRGTILRPSRAHSQLVSAPLLILYREEALKRWIPSRCQNCNLLLGD